MRNHERSIASWRKQMTAAGIKCPSVLDELESHLREEIDRQLQSGVTEEQAFETATRKLGSIASLKAAFKKSSAAARIAEKLMIALAALLVAFIVFLTTVTIVLCYGSFVERLVGFAALGSILIATLGWPHLIPYLPVIRPKSKRLAIEATCFLSGFGLCTFYVQLIVHHFERAGEAIPALGFWGILPIAVGFGIGCALELTAQQAAARSAA